MRYWPRANGHFVYIHQPRYVVAALLEQAHCVTASAINIEDSSRHARQEVNRLMAGYVLVRSFEPMCECRRLAPVCRTLQPSMGSWLRGGAFQARVDKEQKQAMSILWARL